MKCIRDYLKEDLKELETVRQYCLNNHSLYFDLSTIYLYWLWYSDDFNASFLVVTDKTLKDFINWLTESEWC
jgi:hypothetical protein